MNNINDFKIRKYSSFKPDKTWYHFPQRSDLSIYFFKMPVSSNITIMIIWKGTTLDEFVIKTLESTSINSFIGKYPSIGFKQSNVEGLILKRFQISFGDIESFKSCSYYIKNNLLIDFNDLDDQLSTKKTITKSQDENKKNTEIFMNESQISSQNHVQQTISMNRFQNFNTQTENYITENDNNNVSQCVSQCVSNPYYNNPNLTYCYSEKQYPIVYNDQNLMFQNHSCSNKNLNGLDFKKIPVQVQQSFSNELYSINQKNNVNSSHNETNVVCDPTLLQKNNSIEPKKSNICKLNDDFVDLNGEFSVFQNFDDEILKSKIIKVLKNKNFIDLVIKIEKIINSS